jgi:hypothetical protein
LQLLLPAASVAQTPAARKPHDVQPERPTVATHAYTVAPGWVEIEGGIEAESYGNDVYGWQGPVLLKLGLAPRLQFDAATSLLRVPPGSTTGLGDIALGLKWHLLERAPIAGDVALIGTVTVPTAPRADGVGTGTTAAALVLVSSQAFGPVEMDLNAGVTHRSGGGTLAPRNASVWTASFSGPVVTTIGWVAELFGYPGTAGQAGQPPIVALLGGPTLLLRKWLALDAGVILPLEGPQPRAFYSGFVWNIGRL